MTTLDTTKANSRHTAPSRPYLQVHPTSKSVRVSVAKDLNTLMKVMSLRTLVYMAEQTCPYDEEFDGNDFTAATHLLAEIGREPVGTLRLRWFAGFVKIERVAIHSAYRGFGVTPSIISEAIEIARKRGYNHVVAYSQKRLMNFWKPFGFTPREGRPNFTWSDHEYVEVEGFLEPHPEPLSLETDPLVLMRPDGVWHEPGVLDLSAEREATNPHR